MPRITESWIRREDQGFVSTTVNHHERLLFLARSQIPCDVSTFVLSIGLTGRLVRLFDPFTYSCLSVRR